MEKELNVNFNLYDFNKENMKQIDPYDPIILNKMCGNVAEYLWNKKRPSYWMLLCRERYDFTIFKISISKIELQQALQECLSNRGKVLDITKQDDGNYEIWIRDFDTDENFVYYLFDYNNAIVEV